MNEDATVTVRERLPAPMATMETIWAVEQTRLGALLRGMEPQLFEAAVRVAPTGVAAVMEIVDGVAVIQIRGLINKRWSYPGWAVNVNDLREAIETATDDESVSAILLHIDSPGGSVDGLAELGDVIFACRDRKSIVAQITGMGASAAYYLASQASVIYAQRMDLIGSIGVRMLFYDWSQMFKMAGVEAVPIDTGEYKSTGVMGAVLTENQREYLQTLVDQYFRDFIDSVARGRGLSEEKLLESSDGRVFIASDALERGLIDGIRNYEDTLAALVGENSNRSAGGTAAQQEIVMGDANAQATKAPEAAETQTGTTAAPVAATLAELKGGLPDSDAEFREECIEAGLPLAAAKDRWLDRLREQNKAQAAELATVKAAGGAVGVEPLGVKPGAGDGEAGGDVIEEFEAAFQKRVDAGMKRDAAMRETVREDPQRHQAYVVAYNERAALRGRR
jgi:signal peptide peptidase SppA